MKRTDIWQLVRPEFTEISDIVQTEVEAQEFIQEAKREFKALNLSLEQQNIIDEYYCGLLAGTETAAYSLGYAEAVRVMALCLKE